MANLILVVGDDHVMQMQLCEFLETIGYRVVQASSTEKALSNYIQLQPNLVLLDACIPGIDGFNCCQQLQKFSPTKYIPVLMITDNASAQKAFASGATDLITKPIEWPILQQRVHRLLEASYAMQILGQQTEPGQISSSDPNIDHKLTEEKLRQSEERFHILARATNDVVWDWDLFTNQVWWNEALVTLFGYMPEQTNSDANWWYDHVHPDDRQRIVTDINAVIASGQQSWANEYRFCRANGSYTYIYDRGYVVHDSAGKPVRMIGVMMDISDRKRVQEELQRENLRSRLFADVTLKIRQSLQIEEILETSVTEVQKLLNADRVVIFKLRPDGSGIVVKEAVVPGFPVTLGANINDPCFNEEYITKYRQGRIAAITNIRDSQIPACYVEFLENIAVKANLVVPILQHNQLWGLLIAHQCAHPRYWNEWETELLKQLADQMGIALAQAKLLEQETRQKQELTRSNDELQEFAFVASHDLQEPLRKIKTFGDRLKANYGDILTEQGLDYLERMQNATRRMQTLIEDLLTLSRVTTRAQPFVPVNLLQITQEVLSDLEVSIQQAGAKVEIGEMPTIHADPLQMRQLLQNLITNALKFQRPEVLPIVKIYSYVLVNSSDPIMANIEQCQIVVEDNGIGFDEKYLDRIFNVFQRLHGRSEYEGTGIGLAICRKIVERHHGSITAQSKRGEGTKFLVTLPFNPHT